MPDINEFSPRSGRMVRTDGTVANQADGIGSDGAQFIYMARRRQQTVQTHNAVPVGGNGWADATGWIDCDGFDKIGITILNDAATNNRANVLWSHDGATKQGDTAAVASVAAIRNGGETPVLARYAKVSLNNGDAGTHTMSAWAYLKA